jgi:hypothetical protein
MSDFEVPSPDPLPMASFLSWLGVSTATRIPAVWAIWMMRHHRPAPRCV